MAGFKHNTLHLITGDPLLKYAQGKDHFLFRLDEAVDWDEFTPRLLEAYKGKARVGESPYHPLILFRMLLLSYLLNTSERSIEEQCRWYIPARLFVGLGIYDAVPDHATLTLFKQRMQEHDGIGGFKVIFDGITEQALAKGVRFGSVQIVDSVHTVANVNNDKDREWHDNGKPSADPDATVVHKGEREVTKADLTTRKEKVMHRGYKTHVSMDAETLIVTSIKPTLGNVADNTQMPDLVEHDAEMGIRAHTYAADRAYDDGELHSMLEGLGRHSAIKLKDYRTGKKDRNRQPWLDMLADPIYQAGLTLRYRIERKFGKPKLGITSGAAVIAASTGS